MLKKEITYCGQKAIIACDGKCDRAWGIDKRPKIQLDDNNEDDYVYLTDTAIITIAPVNPGTYEDGCAKPTNDEEKLNKWCCRQCERCVMSNPGEFDKPIILPDFSKKVYNIKSDKNNVNQIIDRIVRYIENNSIESENDWDYGTKFINAEKLVNYIMEITPEE